MTKIPTLKEAYLGNVSFIHERTLFATLHGSHAYGLNTPTSDVDVKGVAVAPRDIYLGFSQSFEQAEQHEPYDLVIYELRKFFRLAAACNPNIIEVLHTEDSEIIHQTPLGEKLIANKDAFISLKAKHTFSGYAHSQLQRIQTHYRWLKNPPTSQPTRAEFQLPNETVIPADQLGVVQATILKKLESFDFDWNVLDEGNRIHLKACISQFLAEMQLTEDEIWIRTGRSLGMNENFLELLKRERQYKSKLDEWRSYQTWLSTRNEKRAELETKYGFDCYTEDTEFLTENGWKTYDEIIEGEKLGTLNKDTGEIEYQDFYERVKKPYSGPIFSFETQNTKISVTPNHRMLILDVARSKKNNFSTSATTGVWKFTSAENLLSGNKSHFRCYVSGNRQQDSEVSLHDLIIVGAYVSEGCVGKRSQESKFKGQPLSLRFSQKEGNRQQVWLDKLLAERSDIKRFGPYRTKKELVWTLTNKEVATRVVNWCGELSENKKLPKWAFNLSSIQTSILLDVLIAGDGSNRSHSRIYHTKSKQLAKDVQAVALSAGFPSVVWGPYSQGMFQVYIGAKKQTDNIIFSKSSPHFSQKEYNGNIVCFSVPNETLITRVDGKPAFHGNTKHGMHLVRLMKMCREIMTTGKVVVKRTHDRDELLGIRNGAWTYEQLIEWSTKQEKELNALYASLKKDNQEGKPLPVPFEPNREFLDSLCMEMITKMI